MVEIAARHAVALQDQPTNGHSTLAPLTDREAEVAGLVADGLTNRLIARRLFLEEGTVANHVRRIRLKLGLSCRAELAAWVARRGSAPPRERSLAGR